MAYTQDDAVRAAVDRAAREAATIAVYQNKDCTEFWVRDAKAARPVSQDWSITVLCMAQRWDKDTIQIRYASARSEWVKC